MYTYTHIYIFSKTSLFCFRNRFWENWFQATCSPPPLPLHSHTLMGFLVLENVLQVQGLKSKTKQQQKKNKEKSSGLIYWIYMFKAYPVKNITVIKYLWRINNKTKKNLSSCKWMLLRRITCCHWDRRNLGWISREVSWQEVLLDWRTESQEKRAQLRHREQTEKNVKKM